MDEIVLDSASQIATPAFVSTRRLHCFCSDVLAVWRGAVLFVPLAEAVVFAIGLLYLLSRRSSNHGQVLVAGRQTGRRRPSRIRSYDFRSVLKRPREISSQLSHPLEICLHHRRAFLIALFRELPWLFAI